MMRQRTLGFLLTASVLLASCAPAQEPTELTQELRAEIVSSLTSENFPEPVEIEMSDSGWLAVKMKVNTSADLMGATPKRYAETALLTVRNNLYEKGIEENIRLSLYGPSPGPGLVSILGTARMTRTGGLSWKDGGL